MSQFNRQPQRTFAKASAIAVCAAALFAAGVAWAANPHFLDVDAEQDGDTVTIDAKVAGLGNEDIVATATLEADVQAICTNPGGKVVPGINKKLELEEQQVIDADEFDKNGNVNIQFEFDLAGAVEDDLCPNGNWEQENVIELLSVELEVDQGGDVITATCEFDGSDIADCVF
jgi:hypothetical protein